VVHVARTAMQLLDVLCIDTHCYSVLLKPNTYVTNRCHTISIVLVERGRDDEKDVAVVNSNHDICRRCVLRGWWIAFFENPTGCLQDGCPSF